MLSVFLLSLFVISSMMSDYVFATENKWQSHESIIFEVGSFISREIESNSEVKIDVARLDRRLKLNNCAEPLRVYWPPGSVKIGNATVGVTCESSKPWKIYTQAKISLVKNVAVLARSVARGEALYQSMVRFEKKDITKNIDQFVGDVTNFENYRFKRSYQAGKAITIRMLEIPLLISRGELVTIVTNSPLLQVKMKGRALSDGAKGRIIRVKNINSNRVIEGEVVAKGKIKILN